MSPTFWPGLNLFQFFFSFAGPIFRSPLEAQGQYVKAQNYWALARLELVGRGALGRGPKQRNSRPISLPIWGGWLAQNWHFQYSMSPPKQLDGFPL